MIMTYEASKRGRRREGERRRAAARLFEEKQSLRERVSRNLPTVTQLPSVIEILLA